MLLTFLLLRWTVNVAGWSFSPLQSTVSLTRTNKPSTKSSFCRGKPILSSSRRRRDDFDSYDDDDGYDRNERSFEYDDRFDDESTDLEDDYGNRRKSVKPRGRSSDDDNEDDDYDYDTDEDTKKLSKSNKSTSNSKNDAGTSEAPRRRGGVYRVTFEGDIPTEQVPRRSSPEPLEWEVVDEDRSSTYVLLPPSHVQRPSAIIHFCGATWFGSAPHVWYNPLLQALVRQTNCAVVATSIPITLWRNPLQHKQLALQIQRHFVHAWQDVILDEYYDVYADGRGDDDDGDANVHLPPVVGVGHSLGARLLTILATLSSSSTTSNENLSDRRDRRRGKSLLDQQPPSYQSLVLMSFTNYGASVGIPGMQALWQQSRKLERWQEEQDSGTPSRSNRQASSRRDSRPSSRSSGRGRRKRNEYEYDEYDEEDNDDEDDNLDWGDVWKEIVDVVGEQATRVQSLLTPRSDDLEVYPSPDQLWKALTKEERYNIPQTLLVQFDDDPIDQSSKLAHILSSSTPTSSLSASSTLNTTTTMNAPANNKRDIKFCRLRGSHLTPIFGSSFTHWLKPRSNKWPSRATKALWKLLRGQPAVEADVSMIELRQSLSRYITDVVVVASQAKGLTTESKKHV